MKRISLIAVIALFASVAGLAQEGESITFKLRVDSADVSSYVFSYRVANDSIVSSRGSAASAVSGTRLSTGFTVPSRPSPLNPLFDELARTEGVTGITVTKSLLDLLPEINSYVEGSGIDIKKIVAKLDQIDVYSSSNGDAKSKMRVICGGFTYKGCVVLMRIKNENENVVFYGENENDYFRSIVMFSDNQEECVLIRLTGKFFKDDTKQIITSQREKSK
jgi:hypothetical protein